MPQSLNQKVVNSFNAGLVTEFSELKFPENASVDELNCDLNRDGSRQRRKGMVQETSGVASSFMSDDFKTIYTGEWLNAGAISGYNLLIIQSGAILNFYNTYKLPYSANKTTFSFDLSPYQTSTTSVANAKCYFTSIGGSLVIVNQNMDSIVLTLNYTSSTLTAQRITFKVRDYDYQSDQNTLTTSVSSAGVSAARKYDTANCGWTGTNGAAALNAWVTAASTYPALVLPWYSGKNSSGNFDTTEWSKIYSGNTLIGNGHYILDFFNKDRSTVSGFSGLTNEVESNRFRTVASYAGRIWYAGLGHGANSGKILFSRIVTSLSSNNVTAATLGNCYQLNDPTAEDFSDMLETDGGLINIPDATNIQKLYASDQFLYVFAENGVWIIAGVRNGTSNTSAFVSSSFSISDFFISKVSSFGLLSTDSFIEADGSPFWWSKNGIHTISVDQSSGMPMEQNISMQSIQSFWNKIPISAKATARNCYDKTNKKIYWLYKGENDTDLNAFSNILILNIPLKAMYPWSVKNNANEYLVSLQYVDAFATNAVDSNVTTTAGVLVTTTASVQITSATYFSSNKASDNIVGLTFNTSDKKIRFYTFTGETFKDYGTNDFDSYCVSGYNFVGDLERRKTAPYVTVFCRSTEEGFVSNGAGYDIIHPSGLTLKALWDFKETTGSPSQSCYRVKPIGSVDSGDLTNNQQDRSVVTTRLKVRGRGRSMRLRFDSEQGKDFILLGYNVIQGTNNAF